MRTLKSYENIIQSMYKLLLIVLFSDYFSQFWYLYESTIHTRGKMAEHKYKVMPVVQFFKRKNQKSQGHFLSLEKNSKYLDHAKYINDFPV